MGCITSTTVKTPPETYIPPQIQINIIAASKTPSFASSISGERQISQSASNSASPTGVDGFTNDAMARSVSYTAEFAEKETVDHGSSQVVQKPSRKQTV